MTRRDLIEAYIGRYEDDPEYRSRYETYSSFMVEKGWVPPTYESWMEGQVTPLIEQASPEDRLEHYLTWNGILGYTSSIYAIATGELD